MKFTKIQNLNLYNYFLLNPLNMSMYIYIFLYYLKKAQNNICMQLSNKKFKIFIPIIYNSV